MKKVIYAIFIPIFHIQFYHINNKNNWCVHDRSEACSGARHLVTPVLKYKNVVLIDTYLYLKNTSHQLYKCLSYEKSKNCNYFNK